MNLAEQIQHRLDNKTKPQGSLGDLEKIVMQIGLIQNCTQPVVEKLKHVVFAGDHGVCAQGVNAFPQAVTEQMVLNFLNGGACVNVFAKQNDVPLFVVNAGVKSRFENVSTSSNFVNAPIAMGTEDFSIAPAMSADQLTQALSLGAQQVKNVDLLTLGEMGIGNTTSAAAIMAALMQIDAKLCVGAGTGSSNEQIQLKANIINDAIGLHQLMFGDAKEILRCLGGFEIAAMVGAMLEAANQKVTVVIDGFIATSAAMLAAAINPDCKTYFIYAHCSDEQGHKMMLEYLGAQPLLNLGLRLGEGTGALLAVPLIQAALSMNLHMASFEDAAVDGKSV